LKGEKIYDLAERLTDNHRQRLVRTLSQENALLTRVLIETRNEVERLRVALAAISSDAAQ
jgi:dynactin complex subunit